MHTAKKFKNFKVYSATMDSNWAAPKRVARSPPPARGTGEILTETMWKPSKEMTWLATAWAAALCRKALLVTGDR